ncbi:DUF3024 domain-containing protein [Diaphorobacter sp. HDW4A]|uniref:DUF3024 domain-containing protein n=1 Tax=Diaphorobacter sp. HDW4A TaxID=2714924 RepID=UPI00140D6D29|nr:DUF3024 domain-containing protein [Diaphorobacter sp. HDW4A]
MALTELEVRRTAKVMCEFLNRKRPPMHVRDQLDLPWTLEGQSVYLLEVRRLKDGRQHERSFAKATWVHTKIIRKIYWERADIKWHGYEPVAAVKSIQGFCDAVEADPYGCFWGQGEAIRCAGAGSIPVLS